MSARRLGVFLTRALAALLWTITGAARAPAHAPDVAPSVLTAADVGTRLRVFAGPGDYKLQNLEVTAAIRRRDGALTDFWPNRARLPTAAQLGTTTDIDGLWLLQPMVYVPSESRAYPVVNRHVLRHPDRIEVEGYARVGAVVYRARTAYRLGADQARLRLSTVFDAVQGSSKKPVGFGDAVKWGNVEYRLDSLRVSERTYKGPARWIGRRGAGGDLLLRARGDQPFWVEYAARISGFQGAIHALYARAALARGQTLEVHRELAYAPLPNPAEPAPSAELATLRLTIHDERGRPLAAKIRVDREGDPGPPFDADGSIDGADRFLWTGNGRVERTLPAGAYQLLVTSGLERDAARLTVNLSAGQTRTLSAALPRALATPGWISADLHLHQAPSVDADVSLPARVVSVAAEGVELAVATDHYVVTDLGPTVRELQGSGVLSARLQTMAGSEVSTVGHRFGHFNAFPLRTDQHIAYDNVSVDELFTSARRALGPAGIFQVNHPRLEPNLGYFSYFGIDDHTGAMTRPGFNTSFDTLEVYNGDDAHDLGLVRRVLCDWLHLLGRGARWTATGSSDSHKLAFLDPGLPRTLIRHGQSRSDDTDVEAAPHAILGALRAGHALVTSGPLIDASVAGRGPGEHALGLGARATLRLRVRAAPWISVSGYEVFVGGSCTPLHQGKIAASTRGERFETMLALPLPGPTFVVVAAYGDTPLPNAARETTLPFAFTNPIWLEP